MSAFVGILFGIPSLRIKGLYLAVATLAAQFFADWAFLRVPFFTNNSSSGSVSVASLSVFGIPIESPASRYLFCLGIVCVFALRTDGVVLAPAATPLVPMGFGVALSALIGGNTVVHAPHTGDHVRMAPIDRSPVAGFRRPG